MPNRILTPAALIFISLLMTAHAATKITDDVYLVPGSFPENQQPDGNSIVIQGPNGLIAIDTGRHRTHTAQIIELATNLHAPIVAIVNTHWHLDHLGGNALLRKNFPDAQIYASDAVRTALGSSLLDYRRQLEQAIVAATANQDVSAWQDEIDLINAGETLAPTRTLDTSSTMKIAGRKLVIHLEHNAVSAADIWVEDPKTSAVISGDLVTVPVPFFDTACAAGWETALRHLATVPFKTLIPGHGSPMTRSQFQTYRHAFSELLLCAQSTKPSVDCASHWMNDVGTLVDGSEQKRVELMIEYYFKTSLRAPGATHSKFCRTPANASP